MLVADNIQAAVHFMSGGAGVSSRIVVAGCGWTVSKSRNQVVATTEGSMGQFQGAE